MKSQHEVFNYLWEAPVLAASYESRDDLSYAPLFALVRICHQTFHVWLQDGQKGVAKITEQSLKVKKVKIYFVFYLFIHYFLYFSGLNPISPWTNRICEGWTCLCPYGPQERGTQQTGWWTLDLRSGQRWSAPAGGKKVIMTFTGCTGWDFCMRWCSYKPLSFPLCSGSAGAAPPEVHTSSVFYRANIRWDRCLINIKTNKQKVTK